MKISTVLFILFTISCLPFLNAQSPQKFKTVNFNFVLQQLSFDVEKNDSELKEAFSLQQKLGKSMFDRLQMDLLITQKWVENGTISPAQMEFYKTYLGTLEKRVLDFEKRSNEILAKKKSELEKSIFYFSKKEVQELGKFEQAMIFDAQGVLFRNDEIEDLTQKLLENIHQDSEYNLWLTEVREGKGLIGQLQDLVIYTKPIFPENEYEWARKKL